MQNRSLSGPAIGAIRALVVATCSRQDIKQFLLEAGANYQRVLAIRVDVGQGSLGYKSKGDIVALGFDTVYQDFERAEADGIALQLVRIVAQKKALERDESALKELEERLAACGISLAELIASGSTIPTLEVAQDAASDADLGEATELLAKALRRMHTAPPGAMTASVSAAESVCRVTLDRLGIGLPAKKQLPDYVNKLCESTNLEALARVGGDRAKKLFGSLRALAGSTYEAAHELSDRHGHGEETPTPTPLVTDILVSSAAALALTLAAALRRGDSRPLQEIMGDSQLL